MKKKKKQKKENWRQISEIQIGAIENDRYRLTDSR